MARVFVVAAPRSGAGLLHELLLHSTNAVSGVLSNREFFQKLMPSGSIDPKEKTLLKQETAENGVMVDYLPFFGSFVSELLTLDKEAKFIWVVRRPSDAIASGLQAFESGKFQYWQQPEGWWGAPWSFGPIENWENLAGKPLAEVVTEQFLKVSKDIQEGTSDLGEKKLLVVAFEDLLVQPSKVVAEVADFIGAQVNQELPEVIPQSSRSFPAAMRPSRRVFLPEIQAAFNERAELHKSAVDLWENSLRFTTAESPVANEPSIPKPEIRPSEGTVFSSNHTTSFVELLAFAKASVAISTYKSGHLIIASKYKQSLNTTFARLPKPMGIAVSGGMLAVGINDSIRTFNNQPGLKDAIEPVGVFDSIYVPRNSVFTGDIAVHEMGYGQEDGRQELWFINTSFSCLCKLDPNFSFVPVWRPPWITALANEDRCHLNGLAMVNGKPKFVTALSQTDEAFGWRGHKGTSGLIMDIETNRLIATGLSMPHSPRWYRDKLWFLESGKGSIASVDFSTGKVTTLATLPGFTRGLAFIGDYALVGLSQVRESVFKELPVTDSSSERNAGVWIVDLRDGQIVGFLKFEGMVTEIFDVAVIPNSRRARVIETSDLTLNSYTLPQEALAQLPVELRPKGDASG